jgi:phage baseplate assembly protein W
MSIGIDMNSINPLHKVPYAYRRDIPWDLSLDFNGDLKMVNDVEALNQSIFTILISNFGDKPLEEFFGANIEELIFESSAPQGFLAHEIKRRLTAAIQLHEPSVIIIKTDVDLSQMDRNNIKVNIVYLMSDGLTVGVFDENLSLFNKEKG